MTVRNQLKLGSGHRYRGGSSTVTPGPVPDAGIDSVGITHGDAQRIQPSPFSFFFL